MGAPSLALRLQAAADGLVLLTPEELQEYLPGLKEEILALARCPLDPEERGAIARFLENAEAALEVDGGPAPG